MTNWNAFGFGGLLPARIVAEHRERYQAVCGRGEVAARLKTAAYRAEKGCAQEHPAVGDFVLLHYNEQGDSLICRTLPRKSRFIRTDSWGRGPSHTETTFQQVAAANFDTVLIVSSLNRDLNPRRLERYLAAAWESGGQPVIVLTKADLAGDAPERVREVSANAAGVPVFAVSAMTGEGLDQLAPYLRPGQTVVLLGSSGVGKSSLINALAGETVMDTGDIREEDARGRHTTTHRQLILLPGGAMVIDTPGMRELGLPTSDGLGDVFAEVEQLARQCRFSDCTHGREPGCAVREALESGLLDEARWENYQKLCREARFSEDKAAYVRKRSKELIKINRQRRHGMGGRL